MNEAAQVDFVLTNAIGQRVWNKSKNLNSGVQQENINVASLPNGLYFLQLRTQQGMVTKQLVVGR